MYNAEKAKYLAGNGALLFKMKKGPPRPPTAYFMFLAEFRADYRKKHPNTKGIKVREREREREGVHVRAHTRERTSKPSGNTHTHARVLTP